MPDLTAPRESTATSPSGVQSNAKLTRPPRPPNPMWKYMGLGENFRPRLPSRNWMIFLTITGAFSSAVIYDKRETRRVQRKWCKLVEHIAKEPLNPKAMPRKLTVFLESPPTDGLRVAQDHFKSYVKPILVASGLDWEFSLGRKEGDIRAELAERIRERRRPIEEKKGLEDPIIRTRKSQGVSTIEGPAGDIVIGRHTWKEYVRGLHEGWLGPLEVPPKEVDERKPVDDLQDSTNGEDMVETTPSPPEKAKEGGDQAKPEQPTQLRPFISTIDYKIASLPSNIPTELDPSAPIPFPHILGFLNTPLRLYRFLNRRTLADDIGRETAAVILAVSRPYEPDMSSSLFSSSIEEQANLTNNSESYLPISSGTEQQETLRGEEQTWPKSVTAQPVNENGPSERPWIDPVVLDSRIAARMRRAALSPEDEIRVQGIMVPETEIEGWVKAWLRGLGRMTLTSLGLGREEKKKVGVEFGELIDETAE